MQLVGQSALSVQNTHQNQNISIRYIHENHRLKLSLRHCNTLKDYSTRPIQTLCLCSYVLFIVCTTWLSNACRKQADHAGWVPESFFSRNRRKLKYSIVLPAWRLKMKFWNAGTIGVQPGVMMLRNLNFSKISLLDQMNGNERILKSILCTLILLELNIRLWDVTKSWSSALFLAPGEAQRKVIRGRGERVVK